MHSIAAALEEKGEEGGGSRKTHVVLLEGKSSTEVGAKTALRVAVDLLPRGAILEHALQRRRE